MFKIESYVTPILLSYVDKYVRDFKPIDAQVSLWGGGVALHNLVLKADVLQQEVALPFTLVSGRIHELLIQVPWTKIMSEPIVVTIDTIECVLSLTPPTPGDEATPAEPQSRRTQVVEAPPGYMQALVRRIVSNIALRVHHLIVKYVQDDVVLSLNVKHLAVDSAGGDWQPAFADIDQAEPVIRRLVRLDDLTLCLDRADSDGKIRFYQEPLLYRCQLDLRVLTRLVSAATRRASSLSVVLRSSRLAWGVTGDQLVLLLRLLRERPALVHKPPPPQPKPSLALPQPLHATSSNSAEPARQESWSEWAWSWLPTWMDREGAVEEAPAPAVPIPVHFAAYLDDISLVFKMMEMEGGSRKRARGVLELSAQHAAVKFALRSPTLLRARIGLRTLTLASRGKCVCGLPQESNREDATVYLCKVDAEEGEGEGEWAWPEEGMSEATVELAQAADEQMRASPHFAKTESHFKSMTEQSQVPSEGAGLGGAEEVITGAGGAGGAGEELDELWLKMAPVLYAEYTHERSPPQPHMNPYENPPADFQYSDWSEVCHSKVKLQPLEVRVSVGLAHRLAAISAAVADVPPAVEPELATRTLTVEECESLLENLPQRRGCVEARGLRVRLLPGEHAAGARADRPDALALELLVPHATLVLTGPLYPHRVCSAACQMPSDAGPLWQGARLHVSGALPAAQAQLVALGAAPRPCARADLRFNVNLLLNRHMFKRESVVLSYTVKIREANVCGSAARLQAAWHVPKSLLARRMSLPLRHSTLLRDALADEESVAIDVTMEDLSLRGYLTRNINTHILSLQAARATALHAPKGGELKQAWLFSAPDTPTTTPYLRCALQWCNTPMATSFDYMGVWTEPVSFSADPLLIAWLAYKPGVRPFTESAAAMGSASMIKSVPSTQYFLRRRTPPSSASRGSRLSGAELVHQRPRSLGSSSEPSERRDDRPKHSVTTGVSTPSWGTGEWAAHAHARLRRMLAHVELGLVLAYVSSATASALDCATVRDAMERHAADHQPVLAISFGRISMHSNSSKKHLWQEIRHDGPTFTAPITEDPDEDSFPWKLRLADVSCYTLEHARISRSRGERSAAGLRSQLKITALAHPNTVLELLTTTVTVSVVTKSLQAKATSRREHKKKHTETSTEEDRMKYFTSGVDFKPSTLKEFFRGPAQRKATPEPEAVPSEQPSVTPARSLGPVVSLGVHVHADTPPVILRLDHEQVHVVAMALHGLQHIVTLLQRGPALAARSYTSLAGSQRSLVRSVSELEEVRSNSEDTPLSENRSELISIFESRTATEAPKLKTFFWFQWVVSRATLVVATQSVKLAFETDDIISTVDLQQHYNQFKIKVASASVRHYERTGSDEWTAGVLGGRVVEAREPANAQEENHFMAVTVTQAQISNLPPNWKEELHPKLLEQRNGVDSMWEIYATLAPLEVVVQPTILENIVSLLHEFAPRSFCPLKAEMAHRSTTWQWPFLYVNAGGLRLLVTSEDDEGGADDTFMIVIGKVSVNPHPENPICRRSVNTGAEATWMGGSGPFEGRQYEMIVNNFAVRSAQFSQLVYQEASEKGSMQSTGGENPALKWSQPVVSPVITPILHAVDIGCVVAPAMYASGSLACGPALELNLVSDCVLELSVQQLGLAQRQHADLLHALVNHRSPGISYDGNDACPYASLLKDFETLDDLSLLSDSISLDETLKPNPMEAGVEGGGGAGGAGSLRDGSARGADSGVDTAHSTMKSARHDENMSSTTNTGKKSVSIAFVDHMADASEYLEVFVTMGAIDVALYAADDGSAEVVALRPPPVTRLPEQPMQINVVFEESEPAKENAASSVGSRTKSLTETCARTADLGKTTLNFKQSMPAARRPEGSIPLLHVTLHQPNLYYWRRKAQKSIQVSLFNAWVGLGTGQDSGQWSAPLLTTARGAPDPVTDIPPALVTVKATAPVAGAGGGAKGTVKVDVERPVQFQVCTDRLLRLKRIMALVSANILRSEEHETPTVQLPLLYRLRRFLLNHSMESVTVSTSQLSVSGAEGAVGWDGVSLQLAAGARPERVSARALLSALLLAVGAASDRRHLMLQPLQLGGELEAAWETWRRAEGGATACEPTVRLTLDLDRVTLDVRPRDLEVLARLRDALRLLAQEPQRTQRASSARSEAESERPAPRLPSALSLHQLSGGISDTELADHYYKDDLRSGAFKIVSGGQLPMAYQVTLHGPGVAWRYPHPRAITRIVAFPLPDQEREVECVLELYSPMLMRWHAHTYFSVPVGEPRELQLCVSTPDTVFAHMWRFRACVPHDCDDVPFEFNMARYQPRIDPLLYECQAEMEYPTGRVAASAEQLSGVVRVDSYFAPRALPRLRLALRLVAFDLHLHNSLPFLSSQATALEGYYVSRPLMRAHRVLTVTARDAAVHAHLGSPHGYKLLFDAKLSGEVLECATGTMEQLVEEFRVEGGVSVAEGRRARLRACAAPVRVALHVPRLRTLRSLATDWQQAIDQYMNVGVTKDEVEPFPRRLVKRELAAKTAAALDGRVSLWLHNSCATALRLGQEGTDEIVPLGPGARLAYRWRSPSAPKKLRIALSGPATDWHWSASVGFTVGVYRVRLEESEGAGGAGAGGPGAGVYAHVRVEESAGRRHMHVGGRLALANMLRYAVLYKVRVRCPVTNQWRHMFMGDLDPESVGRSVMCAADCEMTLKIKFAHHEIGWSGDIPLKECPKENVPWLVKVPCDGEVPYMSVWCRVVRARSDGRVLATLWPLYVLHSHLPLDTDVLMVSETNANFLENVEEKNTAPRVQTAGGRGRSTHLVAPGTTSARHSLSFQYRNIECPVTREAIPLHYGVTDTSVFDKRTPVASIEDVIVELLAWIERSGRDAESTWPYSVVSKHWPGKWQPALLQPRCDVTARYSAVRAGGGCSLELQLCPLVLLCNAAPIALTLRAHDAAPLCKLEAGAAIAPPAALLKKPFFISVEVGRETFVSAQLEVSAEPPGRYETPPPGRVTLDRASPFLVHCNQKVALLTMYYEIKHEINVLGVSTTYMLINNLDTDILVSAVAVPLDVGEEEELRPKTFKVVEPTKEGSIHGTPLCRFWVRGRWRGGGDPNELAAFLCVALPAAGYPASAPVPVRLAEPPLRRALALSDAAGRPVPVVVSQLKHEGRWIVGVARDPCPQFLVHNRTRTPLALAQPAADVPNPASGRVEAVSECLGARWRCSVGAGALTHYSSPLHCARYPPPPAPAPPPDARLQMLTFARDRDEGEPEWCAPVAVADGSQLVQLSGGVTVKLRVRTQPHSTLLELQDVDQHDISASDIRNRLLEPHLSKDTLYLSRADWDKSSTRKLERTGGDDKLLENSQSPEELSDEPTEQFAESGTELMGAEQSDAELSVNTPLPALADTGAQSVPTKLTSSLQVIKDSVRLVEPHRDDQDEELDDEMDGKSAQCQSNETCASDMSFLYPEMTRAEWEEGAGSRSLEGGAECARVLVQELSLELAASAEARPLLALHVTRASLLVLAEPKRIKTTLSIAGVQIDNQQYESGQFDFGVVAATAAPGEGGGEAAGEERWPPLWSLLADRCALATRRDHARLLLQVHHDSWQAGDYRYTELTELEVSAGPLALYIEDAYVSALVALARLALPAPAHAPPALAELRALHAPLRLQALEVHPLDLTLTLHTAVRMYIALDQSPLHLGAFRLTRAVTSVEQLTHALTVHYLSAAILGAGWVVGGLELLGAPGALAARVGGASGGVRGVASAAAAALVRSFSAWAGSLARNLDLLAGDEEHARRAAAARRRPPPSLVAGLMAGITNFAINILGAVGGLAHHPLVGVAVGETASGAAALRRGLLGALAKPLSATADLVAYAGHGLLTQTGWDPVPQPRESRWRGNGGAAASWRRDCVRWLFRLAELTALAGFEVLLDNAPLQLLITHKLLVVADLETEKIVEMIDFKFCSLEPYQGPIIQLRVKQRRVTKMTETRVIDEDDEYQLSAAAMARVARYTGTEASASVVSGTGGSTAAGSAVGEERVLSLLAGPGRAHALHAALAAAVRHSSDAHFALL